MSYYVVEPPRRERMAGVSALIALLVLLALALFAGWASSQPVRITVDGSPGSLRAGAAVSDLADAKVLEGTSGDLIGLNGSVVRRGGGEPPTIARNGRPAPLSQRLFPGDIIVSAPGADRRESVVTTELPLPFKTRYEGSGSLTELSALGSPGIRRVTRGEASGIEITSTVLREPSDMVITRLWPTTGRLVALTFDDGPWPGQTDRILDVLDEAGVKATFFLVGRQVKRHPGIARRVVRAGHDVGTHTYGHVYLPGMRPSAARKQIVSGKKAVERISDHENTWIRPPYGAIDARSWSVIRRLKMRVVLWDVDSRDWTKPGSRRIENTVVRTTRPGSVILMHDGGGDRRQTIEALPRIIRRLRAKGYTFVTVDELAKARAKSAARKRARARVRGAATKRQAPARDGQG